MQTVGRWGLRVPDGTDPPNVPLRMLQLATDLTDVAKDNQGTLAARPTSTVLSPGISGRYYRDSDNGAVARDYGTGWQRLAPARLSGTYATRPGATDELVGVSYFATDKWMEWLCVAGMPAAWLLVRADPMPVNALPAGPIDGQRISLDLSIFVAQPAAGATTVGRQAFRYNAGSASAYKWEREALGEVVARVAVQEQAGAGPVWGNAPTVGPMFTLPAGIGGDFDFEGHASVSASGTQSPGIGVSVNDAIPTPIPGADGYATVATNGHIFSPSTPVVQKTGLVAGDTVRLKYNGGAAAAGLFSRRSLLMRPIRLG